MAAKNFMAERSVAQTENAVFENGEEIHEQVRKKNPRYLQGEPSYPGCVNARDEAGASCGKNPRDAGLHCDDPAEYSRAVGLFRRFKRSTYQ